MSEGFVASHVRIVASGSGEALPAEFLPMDPELWDPERRRVTVLLDVHDTERRGGTGGTIDWTAAASVASRRRIVLAGGLTPENVTDAVTVVRPFGIDVSSGVERAPGVKDHARIRTLFENLHAISHLTSRS